MKRGILLLISTKEFSAEEIQKIANRTINFLERDGIRKAQRMPEFPDVPIIALKELNENGAN
jgi:hypothetical protein